MEVYLDYSATTCPSAKAFDKMKKVLLTDYGNPSSMHQKGMDAENVMKEARSILAKSLKVNDKEIIFTSGGSESNNLAIIGAALANQRAGKHIITTQIEHAAVRNPMEYLKEQGFEITYLGVDEFGCISLEELKNAMTEQTILVSVMHVNNEIGTIEPIAEAAKIIHEINPNCLFHVDAIQSYGKLVLYPKKMGIDMCSVSGHKIHGPKGSGFLYVREKVKLKPLIYGGGQENGYRSGTENVPAIAGLAVAAEEMTSDLTGHFAHFKQLHDEFVQGILTITGVSINSPKNEMAVPYIISVSVADVRSEVMLHALEERGIYVSAGSACSSNRPAVSQTLQAIHLRQDLLDKTIRFSFGVDTTSEEIEYSVNTMKEIIPVLSKYRRH